MSSSGDSPSSWELMLSSALDMVGTPRKLLGVPGGVSDTSSVQMDPEQPPSSVREIVVVNEVSVVYVRRGPGVDVCGGRIGTNKARFCMVACEAGTTGCRYASHSVKVDIPFPAYFIPATKGTSAFCEPYLVEPNEGFNQVIINTLSGKRSPSEWTKIFPTIAAASDLNDVQQLDIIARGERTVTAGPTPMKRRVVFTERDISLESLSVEGDHASEDESEFSGHAYDLALIEPDTGFDDSLKQITSYWNVIVSSGSKQLRLLRAVEQDAQSNMEEIDDKIVQVASTVGTKPLDCDLPLTLWSAIAAVSEEMSACHLLVTTRHADVLEAREVLVRRLDVVADKVIDVSKVVEEKVKPLVQMLSAAVKDLQGQGATGPRGDLRGMGQESVSTSAGGEHSALVSEIEKLKATIGIMATKELEVNRKFTELSRRMNNIENSQTVPQNRDANNQRATEEEQSRVQSQLYALRRAIDNISHASGGATNNQVETSVGNLVSEMATIRDQMALLELDNVRIRSEILTDSMSFGGHVFMTEESYVDFVITHFPKGQTLFLLDFISMCECASTRNRSTADGIKNIKLLYGAGFESTNEATVFASFGTVFPVLFGDEHDSKDATKKMGSMTNMKEWDPNTNRAGRKNTINTALVNFKRATELQITSVFGQSAVSALFFRSLLQSSWSFWEALISWISHFEHEMVSQMGAEGSEPQKAQIWNLICWLLHSMFTEMEVRRAPGGVAQSIDKTDAPGRCAAILHGTLGGQKFMSELVDAGFSRHPLFAATMAEFLMTTKASVIVLEEIRATAKSALVAARGLQSEKDKKGKKGGGGNDTPYDTVASPPGVVELGGWMPGCKSSGEVASSVDGLVRWSFGVGEEGIKCNGTRHDKAFIIDDKFPCWFTAARAVGLNILGIWLTSEDHIPLSYLTSITRDVAIYRGPHPLKRAMEFIGESAFILVGGVIPDLLVEDNIFDSKLKAVLTTKQINRTLPSKWMESHHKVIHSAMGGVTNGKHTVSVYSRSHTAHVFVLKGCPPQDLRSILKAGEPGNMTCNLSLPISNDAVKEVRYCRGNVIENASLMPVNQPSIKVRTQWRGQFWIERELSTFERLLAVDVPEKLIRLIPEGSERALLVDMVHSPSKSLHGFLEGFLRQSINAQIGTKRKTGMSEVIPMLGRSAKARKTSQAEDGYGGVYESASRTRLFVNKLAVIFESEFEANDEVICQTDRDVEAVSDTKHNAKATKNDDAEVRTNLWDRHLLLGLHITVQNRDTSASLEVLRRWLLAIWKRRLTRSFFSWLIKNKPCQESVLISLMKDARDCLTRSANATWWTWDAGSRPFFWRWPEDYLEVARLGAPVWLDEQVKPWTRQQKGTKDGVRREMIQSKLETIRSKQYVETGPIISLMSFFDVPKGDDDIRMVYDGSASGLNDHLWAPWFSLPTIDCLLRSLEPGYSMADNDVGEMFHNFMLNEKLRKYCGLDMSNFISKTTREAKGMKVWFRWNRLAMGLRSSPYSAVQGMMIAREVILGNKDEEANVFRWDSVRLNLPGSETYTPSQAWCTKIRKDGTVAADVFIYVDDIRCSAPTQEEAWKGSQRTSSILGFLGLQDAARKRRDPGQETGAWTGSVVWTSNQLLTVLTTQEKWDKAKSHLEWIKQNIDDANGLENKRLQSIRGFLVYVSRTYGSLVPYLKGLHATIDSWRYGRTAAGWKKGAKKLKKSESEYEENELDWEERLGLTQLSESEPLLVFPVPRFRKDLVCLIELMSSKSPPQRLGRMNTHARVIYGFGDASKHGFGASIELSDKTIFWRFGQWRLEEEYRSQSHIKNLTLMEERSSNYRELRNLVEVLESAFEEGMLQDREIFMFTDNTTAEAAFFKGTSSSELLFELVLRLRKLEMTGKCVIHMIHVAGTRMINQGTDGLSRGDKTSGVMAGDAMLSFVPLNLTAFDRSEELKSWMTKLFLDEALLEWQTIFLVANDWPDVMPNGKTYIWAPPPAIADVAGEYLAQATHKRTHSTHIFICPRLMTSRWNRIVRKATDIILTVPIGSSLWGTDQHEPLMICISFPLSRDRPWKHGGTPYCDHLGKILPSMLHSDPTRAGFELRECFLRAWRMAQL